MPFAADAAAAAGLVLGRIGTIEALRRHQTARLRALVRHAYRTVPFYRRRFDEARVRPDDIRTLDDLRRLPPTPKAELRDAPETDVISSACNPARLVRYGTGGSTGQPMVVRMTRVEDYLQRASRLQAMFGLGLRLTDRRAAVLFSRAPNHATLLERIGLMRYRVVHAFDSMDRVVAALRDERPDVLRGYPSVLADIAGRLTDDDRRSIHPRFVTTDSEPLTDLARVRIERGFRAPVIDFYDCFECNVIARQCPQTGLYHVLDHALLVEVLAGDGPAEAGEPGEVAITALHSFAAPLIRYTIGDVVEQGPRTCPCGAPHACLNRVYGRTHDRFVLADGRIVQPKLLAVRIYPMCADLQRYQIVQESVDRVVVRLQPAAGVTLAADRVETMRAGMAGDVGVGVTVRVDVVSDIPALANGKFQPYRSEVTGPGAG